MNHFGDRRRVIIVGAGLGGTATAVRLLQFAREPVEIVLLERRTEYRQAGVAYHRESNHWCHVFNIQAGRMSAFREDVDDFVAWANHEADRTGWPLEWSGFTFTESGPAPRRIYPDYLADRLAQAAREAVEGVTLVEIEGEAVDLDVHAGHVDVVVDGVSSGVATFRADHVVLATGLEQKYPSFADGVLDHPSFVRYPYSAAGTEQILGLRRDAVVTVVGTLLSAYDSAALLLRHGHTGKIYLISGSGLTLRTYPTDHRHRVLDLPPPRLRGDGYQGREDFVRRFEDEWRRACLTVIREYPEIPIAVVTECVAKSWEPYLPEILARIPSADLRVLLDRYGSQLAVLRVGVMAYTAEVVDAAMVKDGQVAVIAGRVGQIDSTDAGTLVLSVTGPAGPRHVEADLVISNFGRESDYERVDSTLWANLLRKGVARVHRRTGRGVEVDGRGNLVGPKNHSVEVAASVLCRLEPCYDSAAATFTDAPDQELTEAISHSTMIEVRRMAARRRDYRQALTSRVDDSLRTIQAIASRDGAAVTDRAVRRAITEFAAAKLTNLSVTPRDLRALLGLENLMESVD